MRHPLLRVLLVLSVLFPAARARAAFGEENIALSALVAQGISQLASLSEIITATRGAMETGAETVRLLRQASEAYRAIEYAVKDPASIFDERANLLTAAFPELRALENEAKLLSREFSGENQQINKFALQQMMQTAAQIPDGVRVLRHLDAAVYGLSDRHMMEKERLSEIERQAAAARSFLLNPTATFELDQKQRDHEMLKSQALTAQTNAAMLSKLQDMALTQSIEEAREREGRISSLEYRQALKDEADSLLGGEDDEEPPLFEPFTPLERYKRNTQ